MSQFDRYTTTAYVEALREFMGFSKNSFLRDHGFIKDTDEPRRGRLPRYDEEPVRALELLVNEKARHAETAQTFEERYRVARDYKAMSDNGVAQALGVSRELVRRWGIAQQRCTKIKELANLLDVSAEWLEEGGEHNLAASTHIGVRVGDESKALREELFGLTQSLVAELPEGSDEQYSQAYIEWKIHNDAELAKVARRAGGRWQILEGLLLFSPWIPIPEHGLSRRNWSDQVEQMIQEELAAKPTVYGAWAALRDRCRALGLSEDEYPKKISLHKRVEKDRQRAEQFGVNLNDVVEASVDRYFPRH